jgi:hypothetical protein
VPKGLSVAVPKGLSVAVPKGLSVAVPKGLSVAAESDRLPVRAGRGVADERGVLFAAEEALSSAEPVAPDEPVVSAVARAGIATTAAPIPRATASAPTRPMQRAATGPATDREPTAIGRAARMRRPQSAEDSLLTVSRIPIEDLQDLPTPKIFALEAHTHQRLLSGD